MLRVNLIVDEGAAQRERVSRLVFLVPPLVLLLCASIAAAGWVAKAEQRRALEEARREVWRAGSEQATAGTASGEATARALDLRRALRADRDALLAVRHNHRDLPPLASALTALAEPAPALAEPAEEGATWSSMALLELGVRIQDDQLRAAGTARQPRDLEELLLRLRAVERLEDARYTALGVAPDGDDATPGFTFTLIATVTHGDAN